MPPGAHPDEKELKALLQSTVSPSLAKETVAVFEQMATYHPSMRKDIRDDFRLRGFVACACCGRPMTAAWSTGRNGKDPYYFCQTKDCSERRKSIRKERLESDILPTLSALVPTRGLFLMVSAMMEELWEYRNARAQDRIEAAQRDLLQIERKTEQLIERIVATDSETLVAAYENQIRKLERDKLVLRERTDSQDQNGGSFKRTYRTAMEFLANPLKLWDSGCLADPRALSRMVLVVSWNTAETKAIEPPKRPCLSRL